MWIVREALYLIAVEEVSRHVRSRLGESGRCAFISLHRRQSYVTYSPDRTSRTLSRALAGASTHKSDTLT